MTKSDLERVVDKGAIRDIADRLGLHYHETSAKTGQGVDLLFDDIAKAVSVQAEASRRLLEEAKAIEREDSSGRQIKYNNSLQIHQSSSSHNKGVGYNGGTNYFACESEACSIM